MPSYANPEPSPPSRDVSVATPAAGLLYTILRHGRGLSHEEAARLSAESVASPPSLAA
jgi:hypothetical protein